MQEASLPPRSFTPKAASLSGPAFGNGYRIIATGMMATLSFWGVRLLLDPDVSGQLNHNLVGGALLAYSLLLYMWWVMMRSTTTLTSTTLSQTWFWSKSTPLAQISYVKFMRLRGLEWLVAPRLYVRAGPGPFVAYFAASPALWEEFEAMAQELGQ